ncbi:MAG: hypothetical protein Q9183_004101 [Haloplaca sp. 2 TL-2023]
MGRKPNQLMSEYFDRGVRLNDNSNRYEQTCKACKEHFPKGRPEFLIAHLETKCPAIGQRDRDRVLAQVHPSSQNNQTFDGVSTDSGDQSQDQDSVRQQICSTTRQTLTGLEVLAEASRRLTTSTKASLNFGFGKSPIDPTLQDASSAHQTPVIRSVTQENDGAHSMAASNGTHAPPETTVLGMQSAPGEPRSEFNGSRDHARLSEIAASATNLGAFMSREKQIDDSMLLVTDEQPLRASGAGVKSLSTGPSIPPAAPSAMSQPLELLPHPSSDPSFSRLHHEHESREPGGSFGKPHGRAQRIRGKFTNSRRQEVLSVRKKGACIRCRMLRKTVRYIKIFPVFWLAGR